VQFALTVATVRDRVVQTAMKLVLEPIFEADFHPCSYGYRPQRDAKMASNAIRDDLYQRAADHAKPESRGLLSRSDRAHDGGRSARSADFTALLSSLFRLGPV